MALWMRRPGPRRSGPMRSFAHKPDHPSLRFKKLGGCADVWSVRINDQYRAVGRRSGDTVVWFWIGTHNAFDKMF